MTTSARAARRAGRTVTLLAACVALGACASRKQQLGMAEFEAIQRQLAAQATATANDAAETASKPPSGPPPIPPRDDAERRARAAKALPPGVDLGRIAAVGDGTRWLLALASAKQDGAAAPHLLIFDVSGPEGVLIGEHDFGDAASDAPAPARMGRALLLDTSAREEPVVLAELLPADDAREPVLGACGWWLRRRRAMFLCAPRLTPTSRFETHEGQLAESWQVDALGGAAGAIGGRTSGRVLRFNDGQWQETDSFRCLGTPLDQAWKQAGRQPLATWQQETVRTLQKAATRAAGGLEGDAAAARLRDALAIDGCAPETWRLLGRLEYETGKPGAARTLAMALALAPRDDGVLLDLADSLAVLRTDLEPQRESWRDVVAVLGSRPGTRPLLDGPAARSPRALARVLYETYLARTSPDDEWLRARRRRVEEALATLDSGTARR